MVPVSAAVVSDRHADVFWDGIESFQQVVDGFGLQGGLAIQGLVQIGHVRAMMFVVMDFHRPGVNVGFQCVEGI